MSLKDVVAGTYRGKIIGGAWGKSKQKNTPLVDFIFEFKNGEARETIKYTIYLSDTIRRDGLTVREAAFNQLAQFGYNDELPLAKDANGNPMFTADHVAAKEYDLVIEDEVVEGKTYKKVKYVNELGGQQMAGLDVKTVLGNVNLKQEMAAARARTSSLKPKQPRTF